jgi:hypothetical protein
MKYLAERKKGKYLLLLLQPVLGVLAKARTCTPQRQQKGNVKTEALNL